MTESYDDGINSGNRIVLLATAVLVVFMLSMIWVSANPIPIRPDALVAGYSFNSIGGPKIEGQNANSHTCTGSFQGACINGYDGDYATRMSPAEHSSAYLQFDFEHPSIESDYNVNHRWNTQTTGTVTYNDNIPDECIISNTIKLRAQTARSMNYTELQLTCYNGSSWTTIRTFDESNWASAVGFYELNIFDSKNPSGDLILDFVGSNDGTVHGATLTENRFGEEDKAYDFNRLANNSITFGNDAVFNTQGTVSFWMKANSVADSQGYITQYATGGNNRLWGIRSVGADGRFMFMISDDGVSVQQIDTGVAPSLTEIQNFVFTFIGNDKLVIYRNGEYINEFSITKSNVYQGSAQLRFGHSVNTYSYADMVLDDVLIYNSALTADEVLALYQYGRLAWGSGFDGDDLAIELILDSKSMNDQVVIGGVDDFTTLETMDFSNLGDVNIAYTISSKIDVKNRSDNTQEFRLKYNYSDDSSSYSEVLSQSGFSGSFNTFNFSNMSNDYNFLQSVEFQNKGPHNGIYAKNWEVVYTYGELRGAKDVSYNQNHGTVNGATLTENRFGEEDKAYDLDGSGGTRINTNYTIDMSKTFTMSFWIKRAGDWTSGSLWDTFNSYHGGEVLFETRDAFGGLRFRYSGDGTGSAIQTSLRNNEWEHLVWVHNAWNGSSHEYSVYKNGAHVGTANSTDQKTYSGELILGKESNGYYEHSIDDVAVFDYALSEDEVEELYLRGNYLGTGDWTPPTTTYAQLNGTTEWNNTDVDFNLSCSDSTSGCALTQYRIDSGVWTNYTTTVTISTDGNHKIDYNSTDNAGNVESTKTSYCAIYKDYKQVIPIRPDALVAGYAFNKHAGDFVGSNDGNVQGATLTENRFGMEDGAYDFNETAENYIQLNDEIVLDINNLTLSMWINANSLNGLNTISGQLGSAYTTTSTRRGPFLFGLNSSGNFQTRYYPRTDSSVNTAVISSTTAQLGEWYFVTYTNYAGLGKLYVNGILEAENPNMVEMVAAGCSIATMDNNTSCIQRFGGQIRAGSAYSYLDGQLDDILIYNSALTANEVEALYQYGRLAFGAGFDGDANDVSFNQNHGTVDGATLTENRFGEEDKAYSFDGEDDYIGTTLIDNNWAYGGGSISAWIYPTGWGENNVGRIVDKTTATNGSNGYMLYINNNGRISFNVNAGTTRASANGSVELNKWTHVLVTWDTDALVTCYVNGVKSGTPGTTGALSGITTTNALRIGNRANATDRTFDGVIDDVAVFDYALSEDEVEELYLRGNYLGAGDWTLPTSNYSRTTIENNDNNTTINLTCTDGTYPCSHTYYQFDSGAWYDTNKTVVDHNSTEYQSTQTAYKLYATYPFEKTVPGLDGNAYHYLDNITSLMKETSSGTASAKYIIYFMDGTNEETSENTTTSATYSTKTFSVTTKTKDVNYIELWMAHTTTTNATWIKDANITYRQISPFIDYEEPGFHTIQYYSADDCGNVETQKHQDLEMSVLLTILYPKNILDLSQLTENWMLKTTGGVILDVTDLNTDYNVYVQPNVLTTLYIRDVNGNYTQNTYTKSYYSDSNTGYDSVQPYLYALATSLVTTINVQNSNTLIAIPDVTIKIYGLLPGIGYTLIGQGVTDSKGQISQLFILGQSYVFDVYYNGTLRQSYDYTALSNSTYIYFNFLNITDTNSLPPITVDTNNDMNTVINEFYSIRNTLFNVCTNQNNCFPSALVAIILTLIVIVVATTITQGAFIGIKGLSIIAFCCFTIFFGIGWIPLFMFAFLGSITLLMAVFVQ